MEEPGEETRGGFTLMTKRGFQVVCIYRVLVVELVSGSMTCCLSYTILFELCDS